MHAATAAIPVISARRKARRRVRANAAGGRVGAAFEQAFARGLPPEPRSAGGGMWSRHQ
jgi:hypothetical protein